MRVFIIFAIVLSVLLATVYAEDGEEELVRTKRQFGFGGFGRPYGFGGFGRPYGFGGFGRPYGFGGFGRPYGFGYPGYGFYG